MNIEHVWPAWGVVNKMWSKSLNGCNYSKVGFITKVRALILSVILRQSLQRKSLHHSSSYVVYVHMEICFPESQIKFSSLVVCSANFNIFSIYYTTFCPQKCGILLRVCEEKVHTLRSLHTVYITLYVMILQLTDWIS